MDVKFIFKEQVSEELLFLLSNHKNNNLRRFSNATFIPMGFKFNKVYWFQENDTLSSFKILCCCFHYNSENWYFLVYFYNGETKEEILENLKNVLIHCIKNKQETVEKGKKAFEHVKNYTWEKKLEAYSSIYKELTKN